MPVTEKYGRVEIHEIADVLEACRRWPDRFKDLDEEDRQATEAYRNFHHRSIKQGSRMRLAPAPKAGTTITEHRKRAFRDYFDFLNALRRDFVRNSVRVDQILQEALEAAQREYPSSELYQFSFSPLDNHWELVLLVPGYIYTHGYHAGNPINVAGEKAVEVAQEVLKKNGLDALVNIVNDRSANREK